MKGEPFVSQNVFDFSDGTNNDDVMVIPSLVVCVGPLHINVATLSNPLILDDPSQVLFTFTPFKLCNSCICLLRQSIVNQVS